MRSALTIVLLLAACKSSKSEPKEAAAARISVQLQLEEMSDGFNVAVQSAATKIAAATDDRKKRRLVLVWQMRIHHYTRSALAEPDVRWAFIDLWTLAIQMLHVFENHPVFGEHQEIALVASRAILASFEKRAAGALTKEQLESIRTSVLDFAEENPIVPGSLRMGNSPMQAHQAGTTNFSTILKMPTKIFSIGGGVKDTAVAISEVGTVVDRIADIMDDMPQILRWQLQIALMDLDQSPTIAALIESSEKISDSVASFAKTADELPSRVQAELKKTLDQIDEEQAGLQATLKEARGVVGDAHATMTEARAAAEAMSGMLKEADTTLQEVRQASDALERAGKAWEPTFREVRRLVNPEDFEEKKEEEAGTATPDPKPVPKEDGAAEEDDSGGSEIKDIGNSADSLTTAAVEMRGLVKEVRDLIRAGEVDDAVTQAQSAAAGLVDRIMWRAIIVIAFFFAMLVGYRLLRPPPR